MKPSLRTKWPSSMLEQICMGCSFGGVTAYFADANNFWSVALFTKFGKTAVKFMGFIFSLFSSHFSTLQLQAESWKEGPSFADICGCTAEGAEGRGGSNNRDLCRTPLKERFYMQIPGSQARCWNPIY